jgi:hypothetical protein
MFSGGDTVVQVHPGTGISVFVRHLSTLDQVFYAIGNEGTTRHARDAKAVVAATGRIRQKPTAEARAGISLYPPCASWSLSTSFMVPGPLVARLTCVSLKIYSLFDSDTNGSLIP